MRYDRMGVEFIKIAAFLQIARYICVALMGPGKQGAWEPSLFKIAYPYVAPGLTSWAILSVTIGVIFLVVGFIQTRKKAENS
jgi:hypothetical protein